MAFPFLRNPLGWASSFLRATVARTAVLVRSPLRALNPANLLGGVGSVIGVLGRTLAEFGAEVEASALRREAEREAAIAAATEAIAGVAAGVIVDDASIPEAISKIRRQYAWTIRVRYIDPKTGERQERYITVSTNERISPDQARRHALEESFPESPAVAGAVISSEVVRVVKAGAQGTL